MPLINKKLNFSDQNSQEKKKNYIPMEKLLIIFNSQRNKLSKNKQEQNQWPTFAAKLHQENERSYFQDCNYRNKQ